MAVGGELAGFDMFLNEKPTLDELYEHARVGTKWYNFGVLLKLDANKLNSIRVMNEDTDFKVVKMFELWLSTNPNARRREIIETLTMKAFGENTLAANYQKALTENYDLMNQICSESLPQLILPTDVLQLLYTEGIISKEIFNDIDKSGGSITDSSLRALHTRLSENPNQLKIFFSILLQSKDTVHVGKDALKKYRCIEQTRPSVHHLSPTFQHAFDEMRGKFGQFFHTVVPLIKSAVLPSSLFSRKASSLKELRKFLGRCFRELKPRLSLSKSFDDIMEIVEEKCTIINIVCLETIINHYNIEKAKMYAKAYQLEVDKFCENVKISICESRDFTTGPSSLLKCETIEFVLEWKADEHSLKEIEELLWKAFESMAKRVLVKQAKKGNSITVTCYAPRNIMDLFQLEAEKNLDILKQMGVTKLTMGYHIVWDAYLRKRYEEACGHEKELAERLNESRLEFDEKESETKQLQCMLKEMEDEVIKVKQLLVQKETEIEQLQSTVVEEKVLEEELKSEKQKLEVTFKEKENTEEELILIKKTSEALHDEISVLKYTLKEKEDDQIQLITDYEQELTELQEEVKSNSIQKKRIIYLIDLVISELTEIKKENEQHIDNERLAYTEERDTTTSVEWNSDGVTLISPTAEQCEEVMRQLRNEQQTKKHWEITIELSSAEILLIMLNNINKCLVRELNIIDTPLDSHCVSKLSHILTYYETIETLRLYSSPLPHNSLQMITDAMSSNTTLKTLTVNGDDTITDKDIAHLCQMLTVNTTLKQLELNNCHNITKFGRHHLSEILNHNETLSNLVINYVHCN